MPCLGTSFGRSSMAAMSPSTCPKSGGDPDEPAVIAISMQKTTKTAEGRGLLDLKWDQRQVANVELLEIGRDLYLVLSAEGSTSLKAPLGAWHVEQEGIPSFYGGPGVGGMIYGSLEW